MLYFVICIWLAVYLNTIVKHAVRYFQIQKSKKILFDYIFSYKYEEPRYREDLKKLLRYYPVISQFVPSPVLSYGDLDLTTERKASAIFTECQMLANFVYRDLLFSLNPIESLKQVMYFPVTIVKHWGFKPNNLVSMILSILGWTAAYFLTMFSPEIKHFLLSLFE